MDDAARDSSHAHYYHRDLARVHHEGYGFHVARTAAGIRDLLADAGIERGAHVVDVGCGSGLLAARLGEIGFAVTGVDASASMLEIARTHAPAASFMLGTLPRVELPVCDAVVSTGHVLNYIATEEQILESVRCIGRAVRPGGLVAFDLMTLEYSERSDIDEIHVKQTDQWTIITRFARPSSHEFVRDMTMFTRREDGLFRRAVEHHTNLIVDEERVLAALREVGCEGEIRVGFGDEDLPTGLVVVVARAGGRVAFGSSGAPG